MLLGMTSVQLKTFFDKDAKMLQNEYRQEGEKSSFIADFSYIKGYQSKISGNDYSNRNSISEQLETLINQFSDEDTKLCLENRFPYLYTKAYYFNRDGPESYASSDAFNLPDSSFSSEDIELLKLGCKQVALSKVSASILHFVSLYFSRILRRSFSHLLFHTQQKQNPWFNNR